MAFSKITDADRLNKGVTGLSDTPNLETSEMQRKFDELANLSIDRFNNHIDEISANTGAANIGAAVPDGFTADNTVQSVLNAIARGTSDNTAVAHTHTNKSVIDLITAVVKEKYDHVAALFQRITSVSQSVLDDTASVPTGHAVVSYVSRMGGGDMLKATYDQDNDGKVDVAEDAEMFGGELPSYYATKAELDTKLDGDGLDTDYNDVITGGSETKAPANSVIKTLNTNIQAQLATMIANFQNGCSRIAAAITGGRDGQGTGGVATASDASVTTMETNITTLANNNYDDGYGVGFAAGQASVRRGTHRFTIRQSGTIPSQTYNTGKGSKLIGAAVTGGSLRFFSYQQNYNAYSPGGVVCNCANGIITVSFSGQPKCETNTSGDLMTVNIDVTYWYFE